MAVAEPASGGIPGQFMPPAEQGARKPGLRILLVDDNALNLSAGQAMMSRFGHQIDTATNGAQAIEAVAVGRYDVVLMDVRMPEMDGPETAHRIRRLDLPQPRIIALSASASSKDRAACRNAGMDGYVLKPLRSPALVELLDKEQEIAGTPTLGTATPGAGIVGAGTLGAGTLGNANPGPTTPGATDLPMRMFAHGHTG